MSWRSERRESVLTYADARQETVVVPETQHEIEIGRLYGVDFLEDGWCLIHSPFDPMARPVPLDAWLDTKALQVNSVSYTVKDALRLVADYEGADANELPAWVAVGVNPDDFDKGRNMKYRLVNSVYFGCLSYPHVLALYTALYVTGRLRELLTKSANALVGVDASTVERSIRDIRTDLVMRARIVNATHEMSAAQEAGPKEQGRRDADREVYWHGVQAGRVALKERQLQVDKPRLRKKRRRADEPGEVEIPAYTALQADQRLADRMLELVLRGVSTRKYETVLPAMADQVGVSKSEVSRETIEAGTRVLKELVERDLSELDVLVVYLDGIVFGDYHVLAAVGVDADGRKHVLGLCGGASENTEVTAGLLEDLVARGLRADRRRLFVIDGAKALRQAIGRVFGSSNLVQRCRNHKVRNVLGHLPKEQHEQARSTLRAAWKLDADEGIRKLEQYASWLEREWPSAAGSLREGLSELFTVNRLGLPKPLRRCLTTTNIIDSSHAGVRQHTNRVSRWQSEEMAVRWAAVTFRETEKHYRRITGYEHLWMLKAHLDEEDGVLAELQKAG